MAFRLVSSGGATNNPTVVNMYASGICHNGGVVELNRSTSGLGTAFNLLTPAASTSTVTTVFGVSTNYVVGTSDSFCRVIPFVPGQLWEADCISAINTLQIGKKMQLSTDLLLANTSYDQTGATGVFLVWNVDGATTGSGKVLGEFIRVEGGVVQNGILTH